MLTAVLYKSRVKVLALGLLLSCYSTLQAHEFWLEPIEFKVANGANIQAHIKVGQGLEGDTYAFFPVKFKRFEVTVDRITNPLKNRFAQKPAVEQATTSNGLHILTYQSNSSKLRYEKRETFERFLKNEGIEWVLDKHKERGIHPLEFTELYQRFAKSLVKVGDGAGKDHQMGLPFEWVVLDNPYSNLGRSTITAQLFFEGSPFPDSHVNVFIKRDGGVVQKKLRTDEQGKVEVSVAKSGLFLINAVHMVEHTRPDEAAWLSLWASTTFLID